MLAVLYCLYQVLEYLNFENKSVILPVGTVVLTYTFYRIMPSYQHAFWFAAVIPYIFPIIVGIFHIGTVLHYFRKTRSTWIYVIFIMWTIFAILIMGGLIETMITVCGVLLGLMLLMTPYIKEHRRKAYIGFVVAGILATCVALFIGLASPGSERRRSAIVELGGNENLTILEALPGGILYTIVYIFGEFFGQVTGHTYSIAFLSTLLLLIISWGIFYIRRYPAQELPAPGNLKIPFVVSVVAGVLAIFAVIYPGVYATSGVVPIRPLILARLIQLIVVLTWAYLTIVSIQRNNLLPRLQRAKTWSIVLIFVSVLLIWSPSVSIFKLLRLFPDYHAYAQSWDERHALLLNTGEDGTIVIPALTYDIEDSFVLEKAEADPEFWINNCVALYYGLDAISVESNEVE